MYRYRVIISVQFKGWKINEIKEVNSRFTRVLDFKKSFILTNSYFYFGAVFIICEFDNKFQDGIKYFRILLSLIILYQFGFFSG
ncbi:unnamed protein product [Rhizophagus irregularis]|nr:unnamed protein product [Rhizophagus irregularis]